MKPFENKTNSFLGAKNFGKIICIDFDGVIADFSKGWQGPEVFGEPIEGAAYWIHMLKRDGWYICILTTRLVTFSLVAWLKRNNITFDDINGRVIEYKIPGTDIDTTDVRLQFYDTKDTDYSPAASNFFWRHNPERASIKPIASVYLDDMAWERGGRQYTNEDWKAVYESLKLRFP